MVAIFTQQTLVPVAGTGSVAEMAITGLALVAPVGSQLCILLRAREGAEMAEMAGQDRVFHPAQAARQGQ